MIKRGKIESRMAFTLVELLVVIAVISILFALLVPSLAKARWFAEQAKCLGNLRQLMLAVHSYAADNNGMLLPARDNVAPTLTGLERLVSGKYLTLNILECPSDRTRTPTADFFSYGYLQGNARSFVQASESGYRYSNGTYIQFNGVSTTFKHMAQLKRPSLDIMFYCSDWPFQSDAYYGWDWSARLHPSYASMYPSLHGNNHDVAFIDGHVSRLSSQQYVDEIYHKSDWDLP